MGKIIINTIGIGRGSHDGWKIFWLGLCFESRAIVQGFPPIFDTVSHIGAAIFRSDFFG